MKTIGPKFLVLLCFLSGHSFAQDNSNELAQKLQNPLASLVAVPILQNLGFSSTQNEETAYGFSVQPIFPIILDKVNVVNRVIWGFGYVPGIIEGVSSIPQGAPQDGMVDGIWAIGDLNYSFYASPKNVKKIAWGVGPSLSMPTANDNRMGTGKWSLGPSFVMVYQNGPWTFDLVFRQTWSIGGDENRIDVNQFVAQPLIAYGLGNGWVINTFPTISANWDFEKGQQWTLPLGAGLSKVTFLGPLPVAVALQYYQYVLRPDLAPQSELRLTTTFILSK